MISACCESWCGEQARQIGIFQLGCTRPSIGMHFQLLYFIQLIETEFGTYSHVVAPQDFLFLSLSPLHPSFICLSLLSLPALRRLAKPQAAVLPAKSHKASTPRKEVPVIGRQLSQKPCLVAVPGSFPLHHGPQPTMAWYTDGLWDPSVSMLCLIAEVFGHCSFV